MSDSQATAPPDESSALYVASWKEDLRVFLDMVSRARPPMENVRDRYADVLNRTLGEEVYPALEEFLSEMTRHGIGGQIYGRGSNYALTLRMDDGFEIAVERDRYREQAHLLPRLVLVVYYEEAGRRYSVAHGTTCDRLKKVEILGRVLEEYKRWSLQRIVSG